MLFFRLTTHHYIFLTQMLNLLVSSWITCQSQVVKFLKMVTLCWKFMQVYLLCTDDDTADASLAWHRKMYYWVPIISFCVMSYSCMAASASLYVILLACMLLCPWLTLTSNWCRCVRDCRLRQAIPTAAAIRHWNWWSLTRSTYAAFCTAVWMTVTSNERLKRFAWCWDSYATDILGQSFHCHHTDQLVLAGTVC